MYRALIIDDESPVREAVKALGYWEKFEISSPLEAADGQSGLEIMDEIAIDIVIVDIKMPVMDGMEFLKRAASKFPNTKYIIVSGFGEFGYAQRAISYHVMDYLLKPIAIEQLNQALQKAVQGLNKDKNIAIFPMIDIINHLSDIYTGANDYGIVLLHKVNQFQSDRNVDFEENFFQLLSNLWDADSYCFVRKENDQDILLAITIPHTSQVYQNGQSKVVDYVADCTAKIIQWLKKEKNIYVIAGVGSFSDNIQGLYPSYYNALYIVNNVNLLEASGGVHTQVEFGDTHKWVSVIDKKKLFTLALEKGNMIYARDMIEKYYQNLEKAGFLSMNDLKRTYMEYVFIFSEIAAEKRVPDYRRILPSISDFSALKNHNDTSELINCIFDLFQKLFESLRKVEHFTIADIVQEIKVYIDENYSDDISLNVFSSKYHMTKEYLSKQFRLG